MRAFLCVVMLLVSADLASAAPAGADSIAGVYTNLRYNVEGGDLLGMELLIIPAPGKDQGHWTVLVQIAEGDAPFTALVQLKAVNGHFEFSLPPGGHYGGFRFEVRPVPTGLLVRGPAGVIEQVLSRGRSYWERT